MHAENNAIVVPKVRLIATITRAAAKLTLAPHRIPEKISLPSESVPMMWLKDGATFDSSTFVALGEYGAITGHNSTRPTSTDANATSKTVYGSRFAMHPSPKRGTRTTTIITLT